ncbi:hypothetical protein SD71_21565 [Cohnella kolymensis]|uniref:Uncharacterized protein n=1 Tax=Cohnella kolymensis TaxID=1590652 RepID=A0ABR4ZZJ1_9BACL|nr:hypothetical protein SD71_21565 [Cohnella kolymensis]
MDHIVEKPFAMMIQFFEPIPILLDDRELFPKLLNHAAEVGRQPTDLILSFESYANEEVTVHHLSGSLRQLY